jgi:hypothetical protein
MSYLSANPCTVYFAHLGRMVHMKQLARETLIPLYTLYQRWHRGDRDTRLVRSPAPRVRRIA